MDFKILIVFVGVLAITAHSLHTASHLQTAASACVTPGVFNSTTGQCECKNGSIADSVTKACVCPK